MKSLTIHFNYKGKEYEAKLMGSRTMGSKIVIDGVGECQPGSNLFYDNKIQHNCGLQGFDPYLGDKCRSCDDSNEKGGLFSLLQELLWSSSRRR